MIIRTFKMDEADFCFRVRSRAFIILFYDEIGPDGVAAGVNAYLPEDYIEMAKDAPFFIVEEDDERIGFFTLRRIDESTAELPLIYLSLKIIRVYDTIFMIHTDTIRGNIF